MPISSTQKLPAEFMESTWPTLLPTADLASLNEFTFSNHLPGYDIASTRNAEGERLAPPPHEVASVFTQPRDDGYPLVSLRFPIILNDSSLSSSPTEISLLGA